MSRFPMPFSYDGAIFFYSDFDAKKLLIYFLEQIRADKEKIKRIENLSYEAVLDKTERKIIEGIVGDVGDAKTLGDIRESVVIDLSMEMIYEYMLDGEGYMVRYFDGSDKATFVGEKMSKNSVKDCFFITVPSVYPWRIPEYMGPKNVDETIEYIKKALCHVVSDRVNWNERLGNLYGIYEKEGE